jgi:phosphatidylglycerol---prolipoprotein diacylglyceryl transferase
VPFPHFDPVLLHIGAIVIGAFHLGSMVVGPFQIGPIDIRWYALAYIAGILLGWRYGVRLIRSPKIWEPITPPISVAQLDDLVLWITFGVIGGGRIGYVLFYGRDAFFADPIEIFRVWHGGMSFHGGFLGVTVAIITFALVNRVDMLRLSDLIAPCVPIGLFFGRIANFINGELWGRPTHLPWGVIFPNAPDNLPRHPSQLYEAGLEGVALFLILRLATHRLGWLKLRGATTGLFILMYGIFRIALENVRQPDVGFDHMPFGLTMGILLSTPMVLAGAWLIWQSRRTPPALAPAAPRHPAE